MTALWVIVLCGALSIVYAIWATSSVLKADAGNARMQEIAAAVAVTSIGTIIAGSPVPRFLDAEGRAIALPRLSYSHFPDSGV